MKHIHAGKGMTDMRTNGGRVFYEMQRVGMYMRCTAIDEATGVEVVVAGPAGQANEAMVKRTAYQKLQYMLRKRQEEQSRRR